MKRSNIEAIRGRRALLSATGATLFVCLLIGLTPAIASRSVLSEYQKSTADLFTSQVDALSQKATLIQTDIVSEVAWLESSASRISRKVLQFFGAAPFAFGAALSIPLDILIGVGKPGLVQPYPVAAARDNALTELCAVSDSKAALPQCARLLNAPGKKL